MLRKLMIGGVVLGLLAGTLGVSSARADDKMSGSKMSGSKMSGSKMSGSKMSGSKMSGKKMGKPAAKCALTPMVCSMDKAPMKAINGTTMKCTKCGMTAPAMCAKCQVKLSKGKCPKCGMTMAQLKGEPAKPAAKPATKKM